MAVGEEDGGGVEGRLEEFREALDRYGHLAGVKFDRDYALRVEEAELLVEEELLPRAREAVKRGLDLKGFIERVEADGLLGRLAGAAASRLGVGGAAAWGEVDYGAALARLAAGEVGDVERVAFVATQGALRAYARAYEEEHGVERRGSAVCPVCGGVSDLMVRKGDGYRMVCPYCFYEWLVGEEAFCPYCGNRDRRFIGVFTDAQGRVGLAYCQACGSAWRVILDPSIKAPRSLLPLIALRAERFRAYLPSGQGG
ncbi:hypothetical protein [Stetteria hydrogenophila]